MAHINFDLIVIGGGPGGYVAAIRAAQLGLKTALIEANHLGGICLNWGCIPTKALLRSAEVYTSMKHASEYGLKAENITFHLDSIVKRSREISKKLSGGVQHLLKKNKVNVFMAQGKWLKRSTEGHVISAGSEQLTAKNVIIATGARARTLPLFKGDDPHIWTYREAMIPESLPSSLAIIGSGAIGIEFASFYNALGSEVTVIEIADRILPAEDQEISTLAQKSFEKQGIKFKLSSQIQSATPYKKGIELMLKTPQGEEKIQSKKIIVAIGIIANTENLGLENTKVKIEKNHILTNSWGETDEPGLYAIGDVAGAPWLAHKASHEGICAVEHLAGLSTVHPMKKENIPGCTYSQPQIASIGLSEQKAKDLGYACKIGRFPFIGNGKAIALGETEGLIKTIFDSKTGELLGAHMIGAEVTELIQGYAIAKTAELTEAELMHTIFPHPTLSEMMHESVLAAFDKAIHI